MKPELQMQLFKNYPSIFAERDLTIEQSCMAWGIECGDGWYDLIDKLCSDLIKLNPSVVAMQVKEKFGGLRFYVTITVPISEKNTDLILERISKAETDSETTCEVCGKKGRIRAGGWLRCLCAEHFKQRQNVE